MVTALEPVLLILNLPTPAYPASSASSCDFTFMLPKSVTPVPPVRVKSDVPSVAKLIKLKSKLS